MHSSVLNVLNAAHILGHYAALRGGHEVELLCEQVSLNVISCTWLKDEDLNIMLKSRFKCHSMIFAHRKFAP